MHQARRTVLKWIFKALGLGSVASLVHWVQRDTAPRYPIRERPYADEVLRLLRPPGALPEREFLAACIRCYRCQDACAPGAIQFYTERDGARYHTPYIDPARAGCTLCNKCGPACPTNALTPFERKADVDMGSVELDEGLCLSYKAKQLRHEQELATQGGRSPQEPPAAGARIPPAGARIPPAGARIPPAGARIPSRTNTSAATLERRGPCGECYMFCPLRNRAIKLEPGRFLAPIIFPEHCVGCGMCEDICRVVVRGIPAIRVVRTRAAVG